MTVPSSGNPEGFTKPKLVRIIARLNVGGPARQACLLHESLAASMDCRLIVGELAEGENDMSYLLASEANVIRLPALSREIRLFSDVKAFWKILKLLRKERPDLVHTHTAKAGAVGRVAAWLVGVPVIVHTYHGHVFHSYFGWWRTRFYLAIERVLGLLSTGVIAISESQSQDLCCRYRVVPREKISVVHNGFDLDGFSRGTMEDARKKLELDRNDFVVAWVGRMAPVKDVGLLNDVITKAARAQARIFFLVVGDGSDRPKLQCLDQASPNMRWLGWRRDVETIWKAADVALLTSQNEGTPTSLIESMAAGVPFVATNVGGVSDLAVGLPQPLPDGMGFQVSNGFLTPRTADALLYCIQQLQRSPELKRQMGEAGRAFVCRQFSTQRLVGELNSLYRELLGRTCKIPISADQSRESSSSKAADAL